MIQVSAESFSILPQAGSEGRTLLGNQASTIFTPLTSSIFLLRDGDLLVAVLTSHFMTHYYRFSNIVRKRVGEVLGIPPEQVLCFSSHNHCCVKLNRNQYSFGNPEPDLVLPETELTDEGKELLETYVETAGRLKGRLQDATIRCGRGHERRISHNRKGRRADGSTYLMREEDRLKLGEDFCGDIDDEAFVLGFFDVENRPIGMLTQFTAHPVTAYHCDHPVVHGEFPQIACEDLSSAMGGIPVGFLQGCAGDTNSKGLLAATPADENAVRAEGYGHQLGETFIGIAGRLEASARNDLQFLQREVTLPFDRVPPQAELEERLAASDRFLQSCEAGDEDATRGCDGLNFPSNMSVPYRRELIGPIRNWLQWALDFHTEGRLNEAPKAVTLRTIALRVGDAAIYGMPCEPLMGIGRKVKRQSAIPFAIPCGYMNDTSIAYVPDSPNARDLDYVSAFYRYTRTMLPYALPAGDALADAGVKMLEELSAS